MKKLYMLAVALLAATGLTAHAEGLADTQTLWAKMYSNSVVNGIKHTTSGYGLVQATDGNLIALASVGSTDNTQDLLFGGDAIGKGSTYGGNSANLSLNINKITPAGELKWSIYSTAGELDNSSSVIAATADGGAVAFLSMRHSDGNSERINIKDAKNVDHEIEFDLEGSSRAYRLMLVKIDTDGGITWIKEIKTNTTADAETYPKWSQGTTNIGQGALAYAIDVDAAGNIYVGGRMDATLTVDNVTIPVHNVATWDGNSQTSVGNIYIIKFDANGNYVKHIVTEGAATQESVRTLKVKDSKLYMFGLVAGLAGTEFSLGGKSATPANALISPCLAQLDTDLNVNYLQFYASTKSGSTLQVPNMLVADEHVYLMGTANFEIAIGEKTFKTTHTRDAWLFQVKAATGEAENCYIHQTNQTGFYSAFVGNDGDLYVAEYGLTTFNGSSYPFNGNNTLYQFKQNDLSEPADQAILSTHPSTGYGLVFDNENDKLYTFTRLVNNNGSGNFINSDLELKTPAFAAVLAAFQLPVSEVAVTGLEIVEGDITLAQGESKQLTVNVTPADATNAAVTWTSSDEDIATVDENGVVTAKKRSTIIRRAPGADVEATAVITATSVSNPQVSTSITVTVNAVTGITTIEAEQSGERIVYDLMGRRVNNPQQGIYIVNGRKVVIR